MARNGSGTYNLPAGNPVVTGTTISSTTHNNTMADIATALTGSLAADGQTPPTANLPMASYKHTTVGNASARDQYSAAGQVQDGAFIWLGTGGGTADVITASSTPAFTAYSAGQTFRFVSSGANTTNATININGLGAKAITKNGTTALAAGDIPSGSVCEIVYDGAQFQLVNAGLVGLGGSAVNARSALGVGIAPRVSGLRGNVNATTPLTKFDLSADIVTLRDANGATVTRYNASTLTCDLGLAGPAANGRDQAGAFPANSWINLFYIWNGTTLATIASTAAHTTGPTLPTGYTHWCYATTLRWNGSSNIVPVACRGADVDHDELLTAFNGTPAVATETAVSVSTLVPPVASRLRGQMVSELTSGTGGAAAALAQIRHKSGKSYCYARPHTGSASNTGVDTSIFSMPNVGQSMFYFWSDDNANGAARALSVDIIGYTVPNGDV